jgi:membrane protein
VVALPIILNTFGLGSFGDTLLRWGRWPVLVIAMLLGLAVLYRYGPSRRSPQWQWPSVGSAFATVTWLAGSALLSFYLANYANYDATYGSLGAAIGFMVWIVDVDHRGAAGRRVECGTGATNIGWQHRGGGKPLGTRGAKMADTVGETKAWDRWDRCDAGAPVIWHSSRNDSCGVDDARIQ